MFLLTRENIQSFDYLRIVHYSSDTLYLQNVTYSPHAPILSYIVRVSESWKSGRKTISSEDNWIGFYHYKLKIAQGARL